ncbi:hypothetical protein E3N88_09628 [Mikania micrantha]|uniref:Nudix hydrolase domain-containing protein n=1 Tax=Mikania micrantha TaxID=192012 RepID=A0A5N6PKA6_9ASTR|nr:hypothetical protein E3N88_09628 [Mikania micrantha]
MLLRSAYRGIERKDRGPEQVGLGYRAVSADPSSGQILLCIPLLVDPRHTLFYLNPVILTELYKPLRPAATGGISEVGGRNRGYLDWGENGEIPYDPIYLTSRTICQPKMHLPLQDFEKKRIFRCVLREERNGRNPATFPVVRRRTKSNFYPSTISQRCERHGRTNEGDADDIRTALREVEEEIGLDPALVDVAVVLEPFVTKDALVHVEIKNHGEFLFSMTYMEMS